MLNVWISSLQGAAGRLLELDGGEFEGSTHQDILGLAVGSQSPPRCGMIRSQTLRWQLGKCVVRPLPGRNWEMSVFRALCTEPGNTSMESAHTCWNTATLFAIVLWDSWMQALLMLRAGWFGDCLLGNNHKSWGARCLNKLLPESCWQLGFIVGTNCREKAENYPLTLLGSRRDPSQSEADYFTVNGIKLFWDLVCLKMTWFYFHT